MLSVSVVVDVVFVVVIAVDGYVFADLLLLLLLLSLLCEMCVGCVFNVVIGFAFVVGIFDVLVFPIVVFVVLLCFLWGGFPSFFILFVIIFVLIGFLLLLYFSSSLYAQIHILNASVDESCFLCNFYEKLADTDFCCCCHFEFKIASLI